MHKAKSARFNSKLRTIFLSGCSIGRFESENNASHSEIGIGFLRPGPEVIGESVRKNAYSGVRSAEWLNRS